MVNGKKEEDASNEKNDAEGGTSSSSSPFSASLFLSGKPSLTCERILVKQKVK